MVTENVSCAHELTVTECSLTLIPTCILLGAVLVDSRCYSQMLKRRQRMGHVMGLPVNEYILKDTLALLFGYQAVEATK